MSRAEVSDCRAASGSGSPLGRVEVRAASQTPAEGHRV
eukprot:CAMPEP_0206014612 /NCGR_PEP_ID=MMETSP1464-20131121/18603_1 /ASSEMBLY_ACC=CAM_ASM_001124 /TAXON_ID=119497 /ORGANISM="Exanthemachrysis gayraliae, Strain RCC1523" /LENGTH=37 /DNA_ID= /DNA_START= /DNA_END= /DNA_ORIENTATION=